MSRFLCHLACFGMLCISSIANSNSSQLQVFTEHFPPYTVVEKDGRLTGRAISHVKQALTLAGFESKIEVIPWARAYEMVLVKPNVLLFSMAKTQQRAARFHWLYKITTLKYDFYSLPDTRVTISRIDDALSYSTVAIRGSYEESKLLSLGFKSGDNLVLVANMESAWQMLNKRRVQTIFASHVPEQRNTTGKKHTYKRHKSIEDRHELFVVASLATPDKTVNALKAAFEVIAQEGRIYP